MGEINGTLPIKSVRCTWEDVDLAEFRFDDKNGNKQLDGEEIEGLFLRFHRTSDQFTPWKLGEEFLVNPLVGTPLLTLVGPQECRPSFPTSVYMKIDEYTIQIKGSKRETNKIESSLKLLKDKFPEVALYVAKHITIIEESSVYCGMASDTTNPTYYFPPNKSDTTYTWIASNLAHEAKHNELFEDFRKKNPEQCVPYEADGGDKSELTCMEFQLAVLERLNAASYEIDHLKSVIEKTKEKIKK